MAEPNTSPAYMHERFVCSECGTLAQQRWWNIALFEVGAAEPTSSDALDNYRAATCMSCGKAFLWRQASRYTFEGRTVEFLGVQVWPSKGGPPPHPDMPDEVLKHYNEARAVLGASPKAAAALLRVAAEALVHHLLEAQGDDSRPMLDKGIAELVRREAIRPSVKRACDVLRVTGNSVLHPGQIDPTDADGATPVQLFNLVNMIVEQAITEPNQLDTMFSALSADKRKGIEDRDRRASAGSDGAGG